MKVQKKKAKKCTQSIAIAALLINVLLFPGVGTIVGGRTSQGLLQMILFLIGVGLSFFLIGIPIIVVVWIWGLISGIQLIKEAE